MSDFGASVEHVRWRRTVAITASGQGGVPVSASPTLDVMAESDGNTQGVDRRKVDVGGGVTGAAGYDQGLSVVMRQFHLVAHNISGAAVRLRLMSVEDPTVTAVERVVMQWLLPNAATLVDGGFAPDGYPIPGSNNGSFIRTAKLMLRLRNLADNAAVNFSVAFPEATGMFCFSASGLLLPARKNWHDQLSRTFTGG